MNSAFGWITCMVIVVSLGASVLLMVSIGRDVRKMTRWFRDSV